MLFLAAPILRDVWPALFEVPDRYGQSPYDWNEFVLKFTNGTVKKVCSAFLLPYFRFCL